jgi:hypothetical protein
MVGLKEDFHDLPDLINTCMAGEASRNGQDPSDHQALTGSQKTGYD